METPTLDKKLLLLVNPVSGKRLFARYMAQVIRTFMDGGYLVTTAVTAARGEATALTARYAKEYDLIVCAGGDGTLNETVSGLLQAGVNKPVGYIPCGSTNDFAVSHGLSVDIEQAAENIMTGQVVPYDVGLFENRCFTYVAAFGAFSSVSYNTDQNLKNTLGHAAYLMGGLWELSQIKPIPLSVSADGVRFEGDFVFGAVCNATSIGGTLQLPDGLVDPADGLLEVLLVRMPEDLLELDEIIHGLLEQDYSSPLIEFVQVKELTVRSAEPLEWALDGEASGAFEVVHIAPVQGFLKLKG
ncbi:MAG: diacylglycerol kinase family lipid kinase [Clostridia bacterium]|nr:diacylglycerol kinase family lipid kinase [Clostridia bacterium]